MNKLKILTIVLLILVNSPPGFSQDAKQKQMVTLSGYIKVKNSGEGMIGATCYFPDLQKGITSNEYGYYSITVPAGKNKVVFSYVGYASQTLTLDLRSDQILDIALDDNSQLIDEVTVFGFAKDHHVNSTDMSVEKLPVALIKKLPSFMGEGIANNWSIYSRIKGLLNIDMDTKKHERGQLFGRLGVAYKAYGFGFATNLDWYGPKKFSRENYGVYVSYAFK